MDDPFAGEAWTGMLSIPREVYFSNGTLKQRPHKDIYQYVSETMCFKFLKNVYRYIAKEDQGTIVEINNSPIDSVRSVELDLNVDERVFLECLEDQMIVTVDMNGFLRTYEFNERFSNMIIVKDSHCFEIFLNDGIYSITEVYKSDIKFYEYTITKGGCGEVEGNIKITKQQFTISFPKSVTLM